MVQLKAMWEPGWVRFSHGKDPQKVADEIYSISDEPTKQQIIDKARDVNSELHDLFEWDDTIAAEKWRGEQAGLILRNLKVEFINPEESGNQEQIKVFEPVRMFYGHPENNEGFISIVKVVGDQDTYAQLLAKAKAELQSFKKKYNILKEFQPIFEMIDDLK